MAALADPRHERMAQLLAAGKPSHEALLEAGYPKGSSYRSNARRLSNKPHIKQRVAELQSQIASCMVVDAAWLQGKVARLAGYEIELHKVKPSDVIAAASLLAKMIPGALVPAKIAPTSPDGTEPYEPSGNSDEDTIRALELFIAKAKAKAEAV